MAITPISSGQNNRASVVSQMLNRGGRTLSQMLGAAIQLGRNTADNQFRQEQAFLTEQRRELNLNQRRAENQRQDFEDDRRFLEEKRRFDLKFGQDEEFQQDRLAQAEQDRAIRVWQVEGGLSLGAERNEIARQGTAASIFNAETGRLQAETSAEELRRRVAQDQNEQRATQAEAQKTARLEQARANFGKRFAQMTPEQRKQAYFSEGIGLGFDATDRRIFAAEAGLGATKSDLDQIDQLPPDRKAQALGIVDSLEELERLRALGVEETDPATGRKKKVRLDPEEFATRRKELETELGKVLGGSRPTADGIFDRARRKTGQ